jgi:hypothetical protein
MKRSIYGFGLMVLLVCLPLVAFAQSGYIPWPATEDTCMVPDGTTLNTFIVSDTASHLTSWLAGTRVYVLKANAKYKWSAALTFTQGGRNIFIRGEYGKDYVIPSTATSDYKPVIVMGGGAALPTAFFTLSGPNVQIVLKNISIAGYDAIATPTDIDNVNLGVISLTGTGGVYLDSCIVNDFTTAVNINGGRNTGVKQVARIYNSIFGSAGTLKKSNFGAGRIVNLNAVGCDTLDMYNNTIFNVIDRVVRYLSSTYPIYSFKFNHNTVMNCLSYHGFITLGWLDSAGVGPFQIKDNLFVDNYVLGADTDWTRQQEMQDNPDKDINGMGKCSWFIARQNTTGNVTPWDISHNYYYVSDSGKAIRDYETGVGLHHVLYGSSAAEPILTSDIARQLNATPGGNSTTAFTKIGIKFNNGPKFMSKMARWYFNPNAGGYWPTTLAIDSANGAGAGKLKDNTKPAKNFVNPATSNPLTQFTTYQNAFNRYPYDLPRMRQDSILDYLDCNYQANVNLNTAGSDGKTIGSTLWQCTGIITSVEGNSSSAIGPNKFSLSQNYPNPFNPATNFLINVKERGLVQVKIFDILGREITTLVNEVKEVGSYPLTWNAASMPSGVYFYQMKAGSFVDTKKMVLLK